MPELVKNKNLTPSKMKEFRVKIKDENFNNKEILNKRIIQNIISPKAFDLLKDLSVINTDLENNFERESFEKSYDVSTISELFDELIDTELLNKKRGKEGIYEFSFKHVQDALEDIADKQNHEHVIKYYEKKKEIIGENVDDSVEVLYHKVKSNSSEQLVDEFLEITKKIQPVHYGFKRSIDVGEELKKKIKKLAEKNPKKYLPRVADTQNILGQLYDDLQRFEEAETAYKEALEIRKKLAFKRPKIFFT